MGLSVTFVSGLRRSGKSALVSLMVGQRLASKPHYLRLVQSGGDKQPPKQVAKPAEDCGVASARWIEYDSDRIFEVLPEALTAIHRKDRYGSVLIEADADPCLRHAYPYDHRIFVMPMPEIVSQVFRDLSQAAGELQRVLDDTAAFASEIFGLFSQNGSVEHEASESRADLTATQMRGFLYSPLGDELATRIQLQPSYHGLVETDVIVVNPSIGASGVETPLCLRRIERLLDRVRGITGRRGELFVCDPNKPTGKVANSLLKVIRPMCAGGK